MGHGNIVALTLVGVTVITLIASNVVSAFINLAKVGYETKVPYKTAFGDFNIPTNLANDSLSKNLSRVNISALPNVTTIPH